MNTLTTKKKFLIHNVIKAVSVKCISTSNQSFNNLNRIVNNKSNLSSSLKKASSIVESSKSLNSNIDLFSASPTLRDPLEYRTMYINSLPPYWKYEDILFRMKKMGNVVNIHMIKNSLGEFLGNAIVTFETIKSVELSLEKMKWKVPHSDPVQLRFHRVLSYPNNEVMNKKVLLVKNIHQDLVNKDLFEYVNSIAKCIHISYPRDYNDNFKNMAFIYFYTTKDAETVFNKLHNRYVLNKQLTVYYADKYYDVSDFRYLVENKVKIDGETSIFLNRVHRLFLQNYIKKLNPRIKNYEKILFNEKEKLYYYNVKCAKDDVQLITNKTVLEGLEEIDNKAKLLYDTFNYEDNKDYVEEKKSLNTLTYNDMNNYRLESNEDNLSRMKLNNNSKI